MKTHKLALLAVVGGLSVLAVGVSIRQLRDTTEAPSMSISDQFHASPTAEPEIQTLRKPVILRAAPDYHAPLNVSPVGKTTGFEGFITDHEPSAVVPAPREFLPLPMTKQPE